MPPPAGVGRQQWALDLLDEQLAGGGAADLRMRPEHGAEDAGIGVGPSAFVGPVSAGNLRQTGQLVLGDEEPAQFEDVHYDIEHRAAADVRLALAVGVCHGGHPVKGDQRKTKRACVEAGIARAELGDIRHAWEEEGLLSLTSAEVDVLLAEAALVARRLEELVVA